jgi:hypothetical protein
LARRLANRKVHSEENQFGICAKAEGALDTQICIPIIPTLIVSLEALDGTLYGHIRERGTEANFEAQTASALLFSKDAGSLIPL